MVDASLAHITHYKTPGAQSCVETLAKGGRQYKKYGVKPKQCYFSAFGPTSKCQLQGQKTTNFFRTYLKV